MSEQENESLLTLVDQLARFVGRPELGAAVRAAFAEKKPLRGLMLTERENAARWLGREAPSDREAAVARVFDAARDLALEQIRAEVKREIGEAPRAAPRPEAFGPADVDPLIAATPAPSMLEKGSRARVLAEARNREPHAFARTGCVTPGAEKLAPKAVVT